MKRLAGNKTAPDSVPVASLATIFSLCIAAGIAEATSCVTSGLPPVYSNQSPLEQ